MEINLSSRHHKMHAVDTYRVSLTVMNWILLPPGYVRISESHTYQFLKINIKLPRESKYIYPPTLWLSYAQMCLG